MLQAQNKDMKTTTWTSSTQLVKLYCQKVQNWDKTLLGQNGVGTKRCWDIML
jgi:hypothetical protein